MTEAVGQPYGTVPSKRSADKVPVQIDWHDYLINLWAPGVAVEQGVTIRPRRSAATGFEYLCATPGVTAKKEPRWPTAVGESVTDGSVVWTSQARSIASQRTSITGSAWDADDGVTLSDQSNADLIYTTFVDGGEDGEDYEVRNLVTLANGEEKEGVAVVPVRDSG